MLDENGLYDPRLRPGGDRSGDGYRIRSDATWDQARAAYLEGETAESVCFRFDLSLGAFRERAKKGGWRRCDQPDRDPLPLTAEDDIDYEADYAELAGHALRQLRRAMARGQASAAAGWMRLHERLTLRAAEAEAEAAKKAAAARPVSVAREQYNERMQARRREAETYIARRDGAPALEIAAAMAARAGPARRRRPRRHRNGAEPAPGRHPERRDSRRSRPSGRGFRRAAADP